MLPDVAAHRAVCRPGIAGWPQHQARPAAGGLALQQEGALRSWLGWEPGVCLGPCINAHSRLATALCCCIQQQPWVLSSRNHNKPHLGSVQEPENEGSEVPAAALRKRLIDKLQLHHRLVRPSEQVSEWFGVPVVSAPRAVTPAGPGSLLPSHQASCSLWRAWCYAAPQCCGRPVAAAGRCGAGRCGGGSQGPGQAHCHCGRAAARPQHHRRVAGRGARRAGQAAGCTHWRGPFCRGLLSRSWWLHQPARTEL